jgi:hypothetical protein
MFGLPCPAILSTIGMPAFLVAPYPRRALLFPVLCRAWSALGTRLFATRFRSGVIPVNRSQAFEPPIQGALAQAEMFRQFPP